VRFFGGSAMWGTGSDDRGTIPAIFNRLHPEAQAFNYGERGLDSRQNVERLVNLLALRRPAELVVFYDGVNDIAALCRNDTRLNGHGQENQIGNKLDVGGGVRGLLWERTFDLVARTRRAVSGAPESGVYDCAKDPARARAVADVVVRDWQIARTLALASCARFITVLQPVAYIGRPRLGQIVDNPAAPKDLESFKDLGQQFRAVYPLWQRLAGQPGMRWLYDFTGAFDGNTLTYIDYVHVSQAGNEIIARRLDALVPPRLRVARGCNRTL